MFDDILIPTDGSEGIQGAIAHGLTLADHYGATVYALCVLDRGMSSERIANTTVVNAFREVRKQNKTQSIDAVTAIATELTPGVTVVETLRRGTPSRVILEYVDEHEIDLVAMGTRGRTGLNRYLLGGVTTAVVRAATVPILTVRLTTDTQTTEYSSILIATDGTAGSNDAILFAIALARQYDAVLHVLYIVDSKYEDNALVESALERNGRRAVATVCVMAAALGVSTTVAVVSGVPYKAIRRYTETEDIDLLVVGTHGRTGVDRFVLGSVAERLIRTTPIPVLTVKSTDDTVE